jgi:maltoporin
VNLKDNFKLNPLQMAVAASLLAASWAAQAQVDFNGYLRAGPGASQKDAARACYGLNGAGLKYRLGNECDIYGEFAVSKTFKSDGLEYKALVMTNIYNPQTDTGDAKVGINQMYVEGKGFDISPVSSFWIGKKFHGRWDVHIVDTFFTNLSGVGAGVDTPVGPGKLGLSFFTNSTPDPKVSGKRLNVDYSGIPLNTDGSLRVLGTLTKADFTGGKGGTALTLQHTQEKFLGGSNNLLLQVAQGSAGLDGNFAGLTDGSNIKGFRMVEAFSWQSGPLGGQLYGMFQNDKVAGVKTNSTSFGGRMSYAFTKNFKLVGELGLSERKPQGADKQKMTKFTIAPTLSVGEGFWSRPELRLYVTSAKWNNAANAAAGANGIIGINTLSNKTSSTSYGAQFEIWF